MRFAAALATVLLVPLLALGCGPGSSTDSTGRSGPSPTTVPTKTATPTQANSPTAASKAAPTGAANSGSPANIKEALSAKEALATAEAKARSVNPDYQLYEILGCHKVANYGSFEKDEHLVQGRCVTWLFQFTRPMQPGSYKGYHQLLLWVSPNGLIKTEEKALDQQAAILAKGKTSDWSVDSTRAMEVAEREGGREYRQANPQWDTARFESDRNALILAVLGFSPYFDTSSGKGKEIAGAKSIVWSVKYPPLDKLYFVIDGATGEVLLKGPPAKK